MMSVTSRFAADGNRADYISYRDNADNGDSLKFTRDPVTANTVRKIGRGALTVGDLTYRNNLGLLPDSVIENWPDRPLSELTEKYLQPILDPSPEMLIIGTGWTNSFAPRELVFALARRGIGLEVMTTPAACRTFNILVGEDRLPGAILYVDA